MCSSYLIGLAAGLVRQLLALVRGVCSEHPELHNCVKLRGKNYGWKLRRVRKIRPVKARERLGLWKWTRG